MLIFIRVSAAKSNSHILPKNASHFTCSYLRVDLKNFPRGETPGPLLTKGRGGGGIKGSCLYRKGMGGKDREEGRQGMRKERGGDGPVAGGELFQGLRGIDDPVCSPYSVHSMN